MEGALAWGDSGTAAEQRQYKSATVRDGPPSESRGNDCDRDAPWMQRPPLLITENGRDRAPAESPGHGGEERPAAERHHPGSDRPATERHHPGSDRPATERHHPGSDRPATERHHPGSDRPATERHHPGSDRPATERHHPGSDRPERHTRGRRDKAVDPYRDERTWLALYGHERGGPPVYDDDGVSQPISSYERLSVERAHTMKDFEKQITELKKENFNLKLRIYFLEEQVQRCGDTSSDELHRMNIELRVEVESLKHDFQEKQHLLVRASKAMESLANQHDLAVQRLREEHLKQLQDAEDAHSHNTQRLDAEAAHEKTEREKMCLLLDQERMHRFTGGERLLVLNEQYTKSVGILEDRDWIIQCLNETVHSKDALIAQLEKQIASVMPYEASGDKNTSNLYLESDVKDLVAPPKPMCDADIPDGKADVSEWQKKIKEMDNLINELQQKLEASKAGSAAEEKNTLKRDKAIQGLTLALKKKAKENDKLSHDNDKLNVALSKARGAAQQVQLQSLRESSHPDYKKLIFTLQAEQDMYSRLLKYERESGSLQKELESIAMLRKWLEENIQANQELRKIMEAQIMAKYKGEDSISFLGDQTSYLSICLDHIDQNECFYAGGLHGTAVSKSIPHFESNELFKHLGEDAGTQTQSHVPTSAGESPKHQQDHEWDSSFNKRNPVIEAAENDAKPTRNQQKTVSSATQTETWAFCHRCIPADVSRFPKERAEFMWCLRDGDLNMPSQRLPQTSNTCKIQGYKQMNCTQEAKKSKLPVLLKSAQNKKLKIGGAVTLATENDHRCPEKGPQIQRCSEREAEPFKENRDFVCENRTPDQEQRGLTQQGLREELVSPHRFSEELEQAESEVVTLNANKEMSRSKESDLHNSKQRESTEGALQKEQQAETRRDSEQPTLAQMETEILTAPLCFTRSSLAVSEISTSNKIRTESTDKASQKELQAGNHGPSEQLEQAQMEIKTLNASEELLRCKTCEYNLCNSEDEQRKSAEGVLQRAENCRLSEQLQRARTEIETLTANEEMRPKNTDVSSSNNQRASEDQTLHNNLQAKNSRLTEELKTARIEIQSLKANAALITHKDLIPDASSPNKVESTDLQKELQAENYRLSEQLKQATTEIEKLHAERSSSDNTDDSLKLHGSDADDDLSEQSCLEKTITNSVNVDEVDVTSDFGDELCRPIVNSRNAVALRCHHYSHCMECANNRGVISLPTSHSKRASSIHSSSKFITVSSRRSFDETSVSKYDLLVQSQARELSLQRQKIKESHDLSVLCSKNFYNVLKAFENLFPTSTLDSNITLGFQEQITQTVEWLKELEYKLSDALYGEEDAYSDHSVDSLLYTPSRLVPGHRMWADKHGCHVLGLVEDYNALRKQILEAGNVLQEMEAFIDHGVESAVLNMTEHFGNIFFEKLTRTKQSLEEAVCLLKLLWRVSLPLQVHSPYNNNQEEEANLELARLRKRVVQQEKLLSGMVSRVYSENQIKEDIEKLILDQLAMTHDILKRAKGNLEVQVVDKLQ